MSVRDQIGE